MSLPTLRRLVGVTTAALVAAVVSVGLASPASAHAELVRSDPADGAVLSTAPRMLTLNFTEHVELRYTKVRIVDGDGQRLTGTSVRATPGPSLDAKGTEGPLQVTVGLPSLPPNTYRLSWSTLSSDDLHATSGVIVFGVQHKVDAAASRSPSEPTPQPVEALLRWIGFLSMGCLLGGLTLYRLLGRARVAAAVDATPDHADADMVAPTRSRLLGLAALGGAAAIVAGVGLLLAQAGTSGRGPLPAAWQIVSTTAYGPRWLTREASLAILLAVVLVLRSGRRTSPRLLGVVTVVAAVALGISTALLGHAGATTPVSTGRVGIDAVHLLAAMVWSGSVLAAVVVLVPLLRRQAGQGGVARAVLRAFGVVAATCLVVLSLTGLVLAGAGIASLDALLFSVYGRTLLLKITVVALAGLLGLTNTMLLHRGVAERVGRILRRPAGWRPVRPDRLGRTVAIEAVAVSTVLALAAVLTAAQPARGPQWTPVETVATIPLASANANDLVETLDIKPNRPGRNFVTVGVFNTRRPEPAPIGAVVITLVSPDGRTNVTRTATSNGAGDYTLATDDITASGRWRVTVAVNRPGLKPAVRSYGWGVAGGGRVAARPVRISAAPLGPVLDRIALAGLVLAMLLPVLFWLRRRRGAPAGPGDDAPDSRPASGEVVPDSVPDSFSSSATESVGHPTG